MHLSNYVDHRNEMEQIVLIILFFIIFTSLQLVLSVGLAKHALTPQ